MLDTTTPIGHPRVEDDEGVAMSVEARIETLERAGLVHPRADAVTAELFCSNNPFFLAADKVQVKYEMLRAVVVDGATVVSAAESHGYSRAEFYLVQAAFSERGMAGLVDGRRGRKGPSKVSPDIAAFLRDAPAERSGAELAREVEARFGVSLHRRTAERVRRG
jgi:transposase